MPPNLFTTRIRTGTVLIYQHHIIKPKSSKIKLVFPGDTGKCIHFPYLMFSIIKMISDHIIEEIYLILVLYFIWKLISNFNSDTGFHTNLLYLDFLIEI